MATPVKYNPVLSLILLFHHLALELATPQCEYRWRKHAFPYFLIHISETSAFG